MNKKIVVVGAGHGGLICAAKLAKNGYDVHVYEMRKREELGHDWEDRFTFDVLLGAVERDEMPEGSWRFRGDCEFVSPSYRTEVKIKYDEKTRQKVMWRKPLIDMLIDYATESGVNWHFEVRVDKPIIKDDRVVGVRTSEGDVFADLIVDASGVFSVLRRQLPDAFNIEKDVNTGDVFYAYRAYFDKTKDVSPEFPFEVYLYHEGEKGLSWFLTNNDSVDVLIGRVYPIDEKKVQEQLAIFKKRHDWLGNNVLYGGNFAVIPVRRPLPIMIADGYCLVGDSAFMTTPMNGMGIDLSILAGQLLAEAVLQDKDGLLDKQTLWKYNRDFHKLYGGDTSKNEGLKNALLSLPAEGVDFLFDNQVIQSSDLAGAGRNTNLKALLGKFVRGMKKPKYFFAIIKGLIKGAKTCKTYKNAPEKYDAKKVEKWQKKIEKYTLKVTL